jgi:tetratricopeptide (TPR) repeat protein
MKLSTYRAYIVAVVALSLLVGCSRDPNVRKQKYYESGQRFYEKGKYREAAIQYANATQVDPRFVDAHYQLGQTYLKLQQWTRAYQELAKVVELAPDNFSARLDLTNLLIAGREFGQAKENLDYLLTKEPSSPEVHVAFGNFYAQEGNLPSAIQEMQKGPSTWT